MKRGIKIGLMLDIVPPKEQTEHHRKIPLEERIKDAICLCESGHESRKEWELLRKVNNYLMQKKKLNNKQKNILKMIQPVLRKFDSGSGGHLLQDSVRLSEVDGLFNWSDD